MGGHSFFRWLRFWQYRNNSAARTHRSPKRPSVRLSLEGLGERTPPTVIGPEAVYDRAPSPDYTTHIAYPNTIPTTAGEYGFSSDANADSTPGIRPLIAIASPTPSQQEDRPAQPNIRPLQPSFVQPAHRKEPESPVNYSFNETGSRSHSTHSRPQISHNPPNGQSMAGMGNGVRGSSTPQVGGGGNGSGSSGAGPGVTNAGQFINFNLGQFGISPPQVTPLTASPPTASATPPASPPANANPPPPTTPASPSHPVTPMDASGPHGRPADDPLYVLDMNNGLTIPANVTLNTFSTWSENLEAQVLGATVSSYSWNTANAPDLTNLSGQSTYNLQGTWKSFTGAAHTDSVTVTETPQSGSLLSQTITFLVAGTDSPAFSTNRPTTSSTWGNVLTPDQVMASQATQDAGPYASLGLADGSVQTSFSMPSYNPNVSPLTLDYNSVAANAQPIFVAHYQLPSGQALPASISAQLIFNNNSLSTVTYNTSNLNPGDWLQIALQANATSLTTGRYPWEIKITNGSTTTYSGNVDILNQAGSPFGAGWSLDNVEQIVSETGGVMLVQPGGTSLWFASNGHGGYITPAGDFSTLTYNGSTYTRTMPDGTQINFNSNGYQTSIVDRDGNTTSFNWSNNQLTSITDMNGQTTTLSYSAGLLSAIEDPALRTASLAYTGGQLTSITDPAGDLWQYRYDSANDLTTLTDPNNHATGFTYEAADRIASVTRADSSIEQLTPVQFNGWAAAGGNVTATLLATGAQAAYTDPRTNLWTTELDWLGYGQDTADIDPLGDAALTFYDPNGLAWMSADGLSRRIRAFFDSKGNPTEIVQPDDTHAQYTYNNFSEVSQYTDPLGKLTTYTYNSKGDLTELTNALGYNTTYAYNNAGLVTSTTDPNGNTTAYNYDSFNRLTKITDALNGVTSYGYDSASDLTSLTDPRGFLSTFAFDQMGRETSATLADSSTTSSVYGYGYDKVGNQTSVTDPLNHTTNYAYDALNRLTSTTDAAGDVTGYGYDGDGNQTSVTDPLGNKTTYAFDAANRLTGITDALSEVTSYGLDAAGEITSLTNPLGHVWKYGYTERGQLSDVTDPIGNQTEYTYDADGNNTQITQVPASNQNGGFFLQQFATTTMMYNALGQETGVTDPLGNTTSYGYDKDGNETSMTDPLGHKWTYGYDALNRLTSTTDPLNNETNYGYDADGNQTSVTDPLGHSTTTSYDAQGRELTATDPLGGVTTLAYDLAGNQTSITDPDNNKTTFFYDADNRLTSETDPLGHGSSYGYDKDSELTSTTDRDGRTIDYGYDAVGRETSETWVNGGYQATYTYDKAGELKEAEDPYSVYAYTYDSVGRMTSVDNAGTPGVPHVLLSYSYDGYSNRTGMTDSLGGSMSYGFDKDHNLTSEALSISGTQYAQVTFGYDAANRLTGMTRTGTAGSDTITRSLSYDNANRLTNITDTDTTKVLTLTNYTYSYDTASRLTGYTDSAGSSLTYGYDNEGELTSASGTLNGSPYSVAYTYDANGNRTMAGYQTSTGNELTSDGTYNYTYDNNGNMVSETNIATGYVTNFTYDYRNRLVEVKAEDNHGNVLNDEKFTYDVNDNRIGVMLNGVQQLYTVYDGHNPYIDFNGSGTLTERYLANPNALSQFFAQVNASGTTDWLLTDNINSIRDVVSTSGSVLDALTYDPFGILISQTNSASEPRLGYAGGANDSITSNYQFDARPYIPGDGRFESQDPLSFSAGDTNLYRYVFNEPTEYIDPSGLALGVVFTTASIPWPARKILERLNGSIGLAIKLKVPPKPRNPGDLLTNNISAGDAAAIYGPNGDQTINQSIGSGIGPAVVLAKIGVQWSASAGAWVRPSSFNPANFFRTPNCFPPDTLVGTEAGLRPISQVEAGDRVWAYDFQSGSWHLCEVDCRHDSNYEGPMVTFDVGLGKVTATAYHPFWVVQGDELENRPALRHVEISEDRDRALPGRWVNSHDLRAGDEVFLRGSGPEKISRVRRHHERTLVCNLTVRNLHTFAVGEAQALVHNVSGSGINITQKGLNHVLDRHVPGGSLSAGKSVFSPGENIPALIHQAQNVNATVQAGGNYQRIVDAGRIIGIDRATGQATSIYTVITNASGNLVTAFPGVP